MASTSETTAPAEPTLPLTEGSPPPAALDELAAAPVASGVELEPVLLSATSGSGVGDGQASLLQACCVGPEHEAPPSAGNGLVQVRDCVQVTVEHVPHADHPQSWRMGK